MSKVIGLYAKDLKVGKKYEVLIKERDVKEVMEIIKETQNLIFFKWVRSDVRSFTNNTLFDKHFWIIKEIDDVKEI